jgi:hypothetical protein
MQLTLFDDIFDSPGTEDQMIEKALLRGSCFSGGKARIWQFAQSHPPIGELANLLRNEYGIGGWGRPTRTDGELHGGHYDSKGMTLRWTQDGKEVEKWFAWTKVAQVLIRMVEQGVYAHE